MLYASGTSNQTKRNTFSHQKMGSNAFVVISKDKLLWLPNMGLIHLFTFTATQAKN
jgi:hypothetical protein